MARNQNEIVHMDRKQALAARMELLQNKASSLVAVLPGHMRSNQKRFMQLAIEVMRNRDLIQCQPQSVLVAIYECARYGLYPGIGEAYIIPRSIQGEKIAMFQMGYKGLLSLIRRSGAITTVEAQCVYANDQFEFELGLAPVLRHVPAALLGKTDQGDFIGVWSMFRMRDSDQPQMHFTSAAEIARRRDLGQNKGDKMSAWSLNLDGMRRKTGLRDALQFLPMTTDLAQAVETEGQIEAGVYDWTTSPLFEEESPTPPDGETKVEPTPARRRPAPRRRKVVNPEPEAGQEPQPQAAEPDTSGQPSLADDMQSDLDEAARGDLIDELRAAMVQAKATLGEARAASIWDHYQLTSKGLDQAPTGTIDAMLRDVQRRLATWKGGD
jgi:recombination protein RecT